MRKISINTLLSSVTKMIIALLILMSIFFVYSFKTARISDDFLKELGISKSAADEKISQAILGGYLDAWGAKNAKNIVLGNRSAVARELLVYTKSYLQSSEFKKEYEALKQNNKPTFDKPKTPEEVRNESINAYKNMIAESEKGLKTADATMKPIFENMVKEGKKQLADAQSPDNKMFANYSKNYPQMLKNMEEGYQRSLKEWEAKYPADPLQFAKPRLEEFLKVTANIDYDAELVSKNGKKYFVKQDYERKDSRWKMAFRAGKEVVEPAREFVQKWLAELN